MQITLNGQPVDTAGPTLRELITEKGYDPDMIVAEVNLELIKRELWQQHVLRDGDTVELLSFVGGG
jgi:sulfur carrier protein